MNWSMVKLAEVCDIQMGSAPKGSSYTELSEGIPLVAGASDYGALYPLPKKATTEPTQVCQTGDLIICVRATIGDLNWADKPYCLGRGVAGLRSKAQLDCNYLFYFIRANEHVLYENSTGSTFPQINKKTLENLLVPLPPVAIQKSIAEKLGKAEMLVKSSLKMESELNALSQAVFLDMFGHNQKMVKLGRYLEFITSGSRGWAQYYSMNGSRFLRSLDVRMNEIGCKEPVYVNAPNNKEAERARVRPGDVLLTITGSQIGRVCWVPDEFGEAYVSQHVAILRLSHELLPEFFSYFMSMESLGQKQISAAQYGQTKPGLNLEQIKSFAIPRVSLDQQKKFVDIMVKINALKGNNRVSLQSYKDEFNALMQRAFSGKLDLKKVA